MPGEDKQETTQNQNSTTAPWAAAQPLLTNLISKYSGMNTDLTDAQKTAISGLTTSANNLPNFGAQAGDAVSNLFGSDTSNQVGMLNTGYADLMKNIGGTASGAELDPYLTPGFADALSRMTGDITNKVKGTYAAAGRDPSGAGSFAGSLGEGLSEGLAPALLQQFNSNKNNQMSAAQQLFQGAGSTASGITSQQQVPLQNAATALGLIPQVSQAYTNPSTTALTAANAAYQTPWTNLAALLNPSAGLAGLGSQTQGTGTSTTVQPQSTMGNIIGGASTAISLASLLSDENAKENIEPVGEMFDGQPIYRYNYKGDHVPHIGLLAQETLDWSPDAVEERGGMLRVHYGRATDRAANMARAA